MKKENKKILVFGGLLTAGVLLGSYWMFFRKKDKPAAETPSKMMAGGGGGGGSFNIPTAILPVGTPTTVVVVEDRSDWRKNAKPVSTATTTSGNVMTTYAPTNPIVAANAPTPTTATTSGMGPLAPSGNPIGSSQTLQTGTSTSGTPLSTSIAPVQTATTTVMTPSNTPAAPAPMAPFDGTKAMEMAAFESPEPYLF